MQLQLGSDVTNYVSPFVTTFVLFFSVHRDHFLPNCISWRELPRLHAFTSTSRNTKRPNRRKERWREIWTHDRNIYLNGKVGVGWACIMAHLLIPSCQGRGGRQPLEHSTRKTTLLRQRSVRHQAACRVANSIIYVPGRL